MTLQGAALIELADDERFPTRAILQHWVHGASKAELIHAMKFRTWPLCSTHWLTPEERRLIRERATIIQMVNELETTEPMMSGR